MANAIAANYNWGGTNYFNMVWKMTRVMKAAGWNTVAHSDGTTKTSAGTNNNDSWGTNANPLNDTYPSGLTSAAAWIVMQGPSTFKFVMNAAPTGTPLRGEGVTQTGTSATGELLGYVWNSEINQGWAVVMPRTGTFNGTGTLTGAISGATITVSSNKEFKREFMFSKNSANSTTGTVYYICADASGESTQLFSYLATQAGCTATVPPGAGGTGNGFPSKGMVVRGAAGSVNHQTFITNLPAGTNSQFSAANAVPSAGTSANGSWWFAHTLTNGQSINFGFFRLDDTEPGDVDPYAILILSSPAVTQANYTPTSTITALNPNSGSGPLVWADITSASSLIWCGNRSRDGYTASYDTGVALTMYCIGSSGSPTISLGGLSNPLRLSNYPATIKPYVAEKCILAYRVAADYFIKGRIRDLLILPAGNRLDTFDNKQSVVFIAITSANTASVALSPWDGSSVPVP